MSNRAFARSVRTRHRLAALCLEGALLHGCAGDLSTWHEELAPDPTPPEDAGASRGDGTSAPEPDAGRAQFDAGLPVRDDASIAPDDAGTDAGLPSPEQRDVTFFVTSDTHLGRPDIDATASSRVMIEAMHGVEGQPYPSELGLATVGAPSGVMITGDLTDDNRRAQWDVFEQLWQENGLGTIRYPVFEGWGNHDFHAGREDVRAAQLARHARRSYPVYVAEGSGGHYAWDFQDVHLVQLNLYPGEEGGLSDFAPDNNNPRHSLAFLRDDLARRVGDSGRPVVLFFHYGFDANGGGAWVDTERSAFYDVIAPYNIVAVFVGHSHAQGFFQVDAGQGRKLDVYMSDDTLTASVGKTGFYVVHLGPDALVVAERTLGRDRPWGFIRRTPLD